MPSDAEDVMTGRDIRLCESTNGRMHLLNLSCSISIDLLRRANIAKWLSRPACVRGVLRSTMRKCVRAFDPLWKLNPPLRAQGHVEAVLAGLADGTIDCISSGHARVLPKRKWKKSIRPVRYGELGNHASFSDHLSHRARKADLVASVGKTY